MDVVISTIGRDKRTPPPWRWPETAKLAGCQVFYLPNTQVMEELLAVWPVPVSRTSRWPRWVWFLLLALHLPIWILGAVVILWR